MKTIEEAAKEYANEHWGENYQTENKMYDEDAFKSGAEFAQRWIPVEEELPEKGYYLVKLSDQTTIYAQFTSFGNWVIFWYRGYGTQDNARPITHWRPIEFK